MRKKVSKVQPKKTHTAKRLSLSGRKSNATPRSRPPPMDRSDPTDFLTKNNQSLPDISNSSSSLGSDSRFAQNSSDVSDSLPPTNVTQRSRKNRNSTLNDTQNASRRKQPKPKKRKQHVLKDIRRLQLTTNLLLSKAPFQRLVREIMQGLKTNVEWRITPASLGALQESAETYLIQLFEDSYACTIHRNRLTLAVKDMWLTKYLRGPNDPGNR